MKKLLTIGIALALIGVLAAPMAAFAADTVITGDITTGFTFNPPPAILLNPMTPGTTATGSSTGNITGNNPSGYAVSAIDNKSSNKGYMVSTASRVLAGKFKIGSSELGVQDADSSRSLYSGTTPVNAVAIPLYVSQAISLTDPADTGYTITITYTVVTNP